MMLDKRIKEPCPFCNRKAEDIQVQVVQAGMCRVYCPACRCTFDFFESRRDAIERWNFRMRD